MKWEESKWRLICKWHPWSLRHSVATKRSQGRSSRSVCDQSFRADNSNCPSRITSGSHISQVWATTLQTSWQVLPVEKTYSAAYKLSIPVGKYTKIERMSVKHCESHKSYTGILTNTTGLSRILLYRTLGGGDITVNTHP